MNGLDRWLEAPYVDAAKNEAAFEEWCEENEVDFDAPDAWDRFEDWQASLQEDAELELAEAERERED